VPQMLNLDLLDAISFSKGCYTDRRSWPAPSTSGASSAARSATDCPRPAPAPLAGLTLDGNKVAEVVMSAPRENGVELLAVTSLEARGRTLRAEDGREAVMVEMPYEIGGND